MRDRGGQFDMAHALAPDSRQRHFAPALVADDALVLHALVLAAQALVILDRPEDAGAEQAVALRLEGAVVDGLRLLDLAGGPRQNLLRGCDRNPDLVEDLSRRRRIEKIHNFLVHGLLLACRSSPAANSKFFCNLAPRPTAASDVVPPTLELCRSTLRPSERISLTSTLNDSGIPASNVSSPRTIASYTLVRPATSSDFTVSISCSV